MPTLTLYLPPSRTAIIQLYERVSGDAYGSPITMTEGDPTEYTATVDVGDYEVQLSGVSTPNGPRFVMRASSTEVITADTWLELDLVVAAGAVSGPVASTGTITSPIIIGDDYLAANGRAFQWTIAAITGYTLGTSTCKFGGAYKDNTWLVNGTVSDAGGGNWTLSFDLPKTATVSLEEGYYSWSVEVLTAGGTEVTRVRSGRNVLLVDKQT